MIEHTGKTLLAIAFGLLPAAGVLAASSAEAPPPPRSDCAAADMHFARLEEPLPDELEALNDFLIGRFFNSREAALFCRRANWQQRRVEFTAAILARARAEGLPADGLERGLAQILEERGKNAVVPIGALRARRGEAEVWVVLAKWEHDMPNSREPLGHIAVHVFADDGERITMVRCS